MNREELIKELESLEVPNRQNLKHKALLRSTLLQSDNFHQTSPWERINNMISRKVLIPIVSMALLVIVIVAGFRVYQNHQFSIRHAQAETLVQNAIAKLESLSPEQKVDLNRYAGGDTANTLQEALEAKDLAIQTNTAQWGLQLVNENVISYTNTGGKKVSLGLTDDGHIAFISVSDPNESLEETVKRSQAEYEKNKQQQESLYNYTPSQMSDMEIILSEANQSFSRKDLGTETVNGKVLHKYEFTDSYGRDLTYAVDDKNTINSISVKNTPQGTTSLNQSSGMTTYVNPFGYQLTYPTNWKGLDGSEGSPYALSYYQITPVEAAMGQPTEYIQITVLQKTMETYVQSLSADVVIQDTTLNGQPAKEYSLDSSGMQNKTYILDKGGKLYVVSYSYDTDASVPMDKLQKALDSFKLK